MWSRIWNTFLLLFSENPSLAEAYHSSGRGNNFDDVRNLALLGLIIVIVSASVSQIINKKNKTLSLFNSIIMGIIFISMARVYLSQILNIIP